MRNYTAPEIESLTISCSFDVEYRVGRDDNENICLLACARDQIASQCVGGGPTSVQKVPIRSKKMKKTQSWHQTDQIFRRDRVRDVPPSQVSSYFRRLLYQMKGDGAFVLPCVITGFGRGGHLLQSRRTRFGASTHHAAVRASALPGFTQSERLSNMKDFSAEETLFFDRISPGVGVQEAVQIVFAYPNEYAVGICSLGYQIVWASLSGMPNTRVTRLFTDAMEELPYRTDLLGFSMSWELDYVGLFAQLEFVNVPRHAVDRAESDPIVFGGGPVLTANPEPFANFYDVVLLGDGEDVLPLFVQTYREHRGEPRRRLLEHLSTVPGVYVPSLYEVTYESATGPIQSIYPKHALPDSAVSQIAATVQKATFRGGTLATSTVVTPKCAWENIFMVEAVRSCPERCAFCLASYVTLPFRAAPVHEQLLPSIDRALQATNRIGILGASVTQHPQFGELLSALREPKYDGMRLSLSSVRTNTVTEELARTLVARGSKSVTVAVESGSERLRQVRAAMRDETERWRVRRCSMFAVINDSMFALFYMWCSLCPQIVNKKLSNEDIVAAAVRAQAGGLSSMKLYGMAGVPGEVSDDHEETVAMLQALKKAAPKLRLTFGCSTFVPKAHTPFQWFGCDARAEKSMKKLGKSLGRIGIDFRPESHKWSIVQALISRGDRRVSLVLETVSGYGDSLGSFRRAFKELKGQIPPLEYYAYEDWPIGVVLPWEHLRTAITPERIVSARRDAEQHFRVDSDQYSRTQLL